MYKLVLNKFWTFFELYIVDEFNNIDLEGNINNKILEAGYRVELLKDNSLYEFQKIIDIYIPDLVVIDSYDIDYNYEKQLKTQNPKLKLLSFDDTYEKHYCDILLNHNISANEKRYNSLVPKWCELRCGVKYTLLRDEFIEEKNKRIIFLAMGGADHTNINIDILEVLQEFKNIDVNIVTTTANQNLEQLQEYVKDKKWIELYINSTKIAKLMRISNFAIVTPSVTLNEVIFMELPFIAIKTADNQDDMYNYLVDNSYLVLDRFDKRQLKGIISDNY